MRDGQVFDVAENLLPDKQRDVVLYCAVGVRASHAAEKLKELGYTSVYVLGDGEGFANWKKAGLPISK
jgi:rhodanese-related sulfurtransferase